jgi:hypothetical protein
MKRLVIYIIDGVAGVAISYRPISALYMMKRVYYNPSQSSVIRMLDATHTTTSTHEKGSWAIIITIEMKGGTK